MNIDRSLQKAASRNRLSRLPLGSVRAGGWLLAQLRRTASGLGGHMDELEPNMIGTPYTSGRLENRIVRKNRAAWCAEQSATYWTGLIELAFTLDHARLKHKAEKWVNRVLARQEPGGYLGAYGKHDDRREDFNGLGCAWAFRALLSYYEATRRTDALKACHRGLLWFVRKWDRHKTDYAGPVLIEPMVIVYLYTGDKRLYRWAREYMAWLGRHSTWPNSVESYLSGKSAYNEYHAVAHGEMVKLPAMLYCADGNRKYLDASKKGLQKIMRNSFQRTGAPSSNHEHISPAGATCSTEYCNFQTFSNTFAWMAAITGEAAYGDAMEKIVFNGAQGARKKDERAIAYMSSPNQLFASLTSCVNGTHPDMEAYAPVYPIACCPAHSVGVIPEYIRSMCMTDASGNLYLTGYGPAVITLKNGRGGGMVIEEATEYPFGDTVRLKIRAARGQRVTVFARMPGWCGHAEIRINGRPFRARKTRRGFLPINREWRNGDVVELKLGMIVRIVKANGPVAVERGPLLFSFKIPVRWKKVKGLSVRPLPEGWSWYEALPDLPHTGYYKFHPCSYALDLRKTDRVRVEYLENGGYPWESSPVRLRVPARKAPHLYPPYPRKTPTIYDNHVITKEKPEMIGLVPYGCTNLRISCFPVVKRRRTR